MCYFFHITLLQLLVFYQSHYRAFQLQHQIQISIPLRTHCSICSGTKNTFIFVNCAWTCTFSTFGRASYLTSYFFHLNVIIHLICLTSCFISIGLTSILIIALGNIFKCDISITTKNRKIMWKFRLSQQFGDALTDSTFIFQLKKWINASNEGWKEWYIHEIPTCFAPFDVMKYKNDGLVLKMWFKNERVFSKFFFNGYARRCFSNLHVGYFRKCISKNITELFLKLVA